MPQALTPEDIRKTTFHVVMRGYARDEVEEFLASVSRIVGTLNERAETGYLNLGVKMGELLQEAKDAADELLANARTDVGNMLQDAKTKAQDLEQSAPRERRGRGAYGDRARHEDRGRGRAAGSRADREREPDPYRAHFTEIAAGAHHRPPWTSGPSDGVGPDR